jgi:dolichol-phosphate mannosyltransferase
VIAVGVLVRLVLAGTVALSPEEAYHWNYGQHPAPGYLDHPPLMAWMSWLTTAVFGWNEWAVRLGPVLIGGAGAWLLGAVARRLFSDRAALCAVLAWEAMPNAVVSSIALLPDSPMIFGWMVALAGLTAALWGGRPAAGWLLAGAGLGLALLGKYTAGVLAPSVVLFLLLSPAHRRHLLTPWPYLAIVVAMAVFSPVLYWNAQNDWASFRFQFARRVSGFQSGHSRVFLTYLGTQLMAMGLLAPVVIAGGVRGVRAAAAREGRSLFLCCLALPPILGFAYAALRGTSHFIWTLPAYPALALLAGAWLSEKAPASGARRLRLFRWGLWGGAAGLLVGAVHAWLGIPGIRPVSELHGWAELAQAAGRERAALDNGAGEAFLLGLGRRYTVESALAFYTRRPDLSHGKNLIGEDGLQYRYWVRPGELRGRNAVVVLEGIPEGGIRRGGDLETLKSWFDAIEPCPVLVTDRGRSTARTFHLFRARGYRGAPEKTRRDEHPDD